MSPEMRELAGFLQGEVELLLPKDLVCCERRIPPLCELPEFRVSDADDSSKGWQLSRLNLFAEPLQRGGEGVPGGFLKFVNK